MRTEAENEDVKSRKNKPVKPKLGKLVLFVVTALIVLYFLAAIIVGLVSGVSTLPAVNGSVTEEFKSSGYIFKDSTIISSPGGGYFVCVVSEGDKVKSGQIVAYMFSNKPDDSVVEKLKSLNGEISQKEGLINNAVYTNEVTGTQTTASEKIRNMSDKRNHHNLSEVRADKAKINASLLSSSTNNDAEKSVDDLKTELSATLNQVGGGLEIKAPVTGVFSSKIDGLEDKIKLENITQATPAYINDLDSMEPYSNAEISYGSPLCKIVSNYSWAYATSVDESEVLDLTEGQAVEMQFPDNSDETIKGTIKRISESENGKKTIVVSTNRYVNGIYSTGKTNAYIITVKAEGIKVPVDAVRAENGKAGLYVLRLGVAKFVPINIKYKNESWAVISAAEPNVGEPKLQIYDEVIVKGKNIQDGKVIR